MPTRSKGSIPGTRGKKIPGTPPSRVPGLRMGGMVTNIPVQPTARQWGKAHRVQLRDNYQRFAGGWGIGWQGLSNLNAVLLEWEHDTQDAIKEAAETLKDAMVAYAQVNAPWQDRTVEERTRAGDPTEGARNSIQGEVVWEPNGNFSIFLSHGSQIYYGIWLEVRWGGRFAILLPTIMKFAPQLGSYIKAQG